MYKPRSLYLVIDQMLPLLIQGGTDTAGLAHIQSMVGFTAPELMPNRWGEAADWLNCHVPLSHPSYRALIAIFAGEPNA